VRACDDRDLLGFDLWPAQRRILEAVERGPRIHAWALGRRSGKSTMCAIVGLWDACLRPELDARVRRGERRHVVVVATNRRQARLVLDAARSIVTGSKLLSGLLLGESEDALEFSTGATFSAFPCTARSGRGWAISTLILDELAFMVDAEGSNAAAESVWQALVPGTLQFGDDARIIASSTPWGSDGLFADLHRQALSGELEDACAWQETTQAMNPTINADWLAAEERRDPVSFRSEYGAEFVGSGGKLFDPAAIDAAVSLPGELRPQDGTAWVAGLDPAFSSDPFGLVLVGRVPGDGRRLVVGLVRSWRPSPRKPASLEQTREIEDTVLAEVAQTIELFGARAVTDQYKAAGVVDRLQRHGIAVRTEAMTAPMKDAAFAFLRGRLNEGSIELYEHTQLLRELRSVSTRYTAGRSSVVLPRIGSSHGDLAQALAIAVLEHDQYAPRRVRATLSRPGAGARVAQGSLVGSDVDLIAQAFRLPSDAVRDLGEVPRESSWNALRRGRSR
jgi:hypothetical protein